MIINKPKVEIEAWLAVGSFLLFAFIAISVLNFKVPADNEKYAMLMLGALIGIVKDTFGRYFQSTKGSQEQREDATEITKAALTAAVTPTPPAPGTAKVEAAPDVKVEVTSGATEPGGEGTAQ